MKYYKKGVKNMKIYEPKLPTLGTMVEKLAAKGKAFSVSGNNIKTSFDGKKFEFVFDEFSPQHALKEANITYPNGTQTKKRFSTYLSGLKINTAKVQKSGAMSVADTYIAHEDGKVRYVKNFKDNGDKTCTTTFSDYSMTQGKPRITFDTGSKKAMPYDVIYKYDNSNNPIPFIKYTHPANVSFVPTEV